MCAWHCVRPLPPLPSPRCCLNHCGQCSLSPPMRWRGRLAPLHLEVRGQVSELSRGQRKPATFCRRLLPTAASASWRDALPAWDVKETGPQGGYPWTGLHAASSRRSAWQCPQSNEALCREAPTSSWAERHRRHGLPGSFQLHETRLRKPPSHHGPWRHACGYRTELESVCSRDSRDVRLPLVDSQSLVCEWSQ